MRFKTGQEIKWSAKYPILIAFLYYVYTTNGNNVEKQII